MQGLAGTLLVPCLPRNDSENLEDGAQVAGCDLISQIPEAIHYLKHVAPERRLVMHNLIYLDGAAHVQASIAMDMISQAVLSLYVGSY